MAKKPMPNMDELYDLKAKKKQTKADNVSEKSTTSDKGSDTPIMSDNISDGPTTADKIDLVRVTVRIDKRQRDRLEQIANNQGRLLSEVVREAIRGYLRGHDA